jgi:hypothetical protein
MFQLTLVISTNKYRAMNYVKLTFLILFMKKSGFKETGIASLSQIYQYLGLCKHNIFSFSFHKIN